MISISVCMIVKNEEAILSRCLDSLKDIADEFIIVDTGSTDNTKKIAQTYTKNVYDFKWTGNFSEARNYSLSKATKEYIYIADADEVIEEENKGKFLQLKNVLLPEIDVVEMKIGNQLDYNTTYNFDVEYRPKLFKKVRPFQFIDPIHEVIDSTIHIYQSDVTITHRPIKSHGERDLQIFRNLIQKGELLSPRLNHMYARELFIVGKEEDFFKANSYFKKILENEKSTEQEIKAAECIVAKAANLRKDSKNFFKIIIKSILNTPCAEICFEIGQYYFFNKDFEEAILWYHTAAFQAQSELNIHYSGDIPLKKLSSCFKQLGQLQESEKYKHLAQNWKIIE